MAQKNRSLSDDQAGVETSIRDAVREACGALHVGNEFAAEFEYVPAERGIPLVTPPRSAAVGDGSPPCGQNVKAGCSRSASGVGRTEFWAGAPAISPTSSSPASASTAVSAAQPARHEDTRQALRHDPRRCLNVRNVPIPENPLTRCRFCCFFNSLASRRRARSSVGQSAVFTWQKSLVRVQPRPPCPGSTRAAPGGRRNCLTLPD